MTRYVQQDELKGVSVTIITIVNLKMLLQSNLVRLVKSGQCRSVICCFCTYCCIVVSETRANE